MSRKMDAIITRLGDPITVAFPEQTFQCPFCDQFGHGSDRKGHLYVNEEKGFFCHRCETRGSIDRLVVLLKIPPEEIAEAPQPLASLQRNLLVPPRQQLKPDEPRTVEYPVELMEVHECPIVAQYASSRGLSPFDWAYYKLKAWYDFRGNHRLLFPDESGDRLVYWTARAVQPGVEPKYEAAKDSDKSMCVWNLNRVNPMKIIWISEGALSARACGPNGVATYGKYVSDIQVRKIAAMAQIGVGVVVDGDARKSAFQIAKKFMGMGIAVRLVLLPDGRDPDDMPSDELTSLLLNARPLVEEDFLTLQLQEMA